MVKAEGTKDRYCMNYNSYPLTILSSRSHLMFVFTNNNYAITLILVFHSSKVGNMHTMLQKLLGSHLISFYFAINNLISI